MFFAEYINHERYMLIFDPVASILNFTYQICHSVDNIFLKQNAVDLWFIFIECVLCSFFAVAIILRFENIFRVFRLHFFITEKIFISIVLQLHENRIDWCETHINIHMHMQTNINLIILPQLIILIKTEMRKRKVMNNIAELN